MGPRKKSKTSHPPTNHVPKASSDPNTSAQPDDESTSLPSGNNRPETTTEPNTPAVFKDGDIRKDPNRVNDQINNKKSWYGSWAQKSRPLSQIEIENVAAERPPSAAPLSQRRPSTPGGPNSPRKYLLGSGRGSIRGMPLDASMAKVTVVSSKGTTVEDQKPEEAPKLQEVDPPLPPDPRQAIDQKDGSSKRPQTSSGWFGWWSRPDGYIEKDEVKEDPTKKDAEFIDAAQGTPLPGVTPSEEVVDAPNVPPNVDGDATPHAAKDGVPGERSGVTPETQSSSWFWWWSRSQNAQNEPPVETKDPQTQDRPLEDQQVPDQPPKDQRDEISEPKPANGSTAQPPSIKNGTTVLGPDTNKQPPQRRKSAGWAFWSREKSGPEAQEEGSVHKQVGELAVADTPSQSHPEAAQFNEQEDPPKKDEPSKSKPARDPKRIKESESSSKAPTPSKLTPAPSPAIKPVEVPLAPAKQPAKQVSKEQTRPNLLLPQFQTTYSLAHEPSFWEQIRRFFLKGDAEHPHLHISPSPPRIKKALAIGVHGFFPSPIFQKVLGAPTGTSIRFANAAANAIKQWTEGRGYNCDIEKVALEGEGLISERVDTLWKLLLNWIDHIREADFILVACHSQGVPVAIVLIAKLIEFGCVAAARVGVCAMAGVNLGPFVDYKTRIFGGTALELFDFSNPASRVSQMYYAALDKVLKHGVRVLYVGSIDDQLVSLEVRHIFPAYNSSKGSYILPSHRHSPMYPIPISTEPYSSTGEFTQPTSSHTSLVSR
jgi:hypothetical protein